MTKEEIIARKNALRATGHNVPVDESCGPNLERLWQSVAPGRYMTSNIEQKESDMRLGIIHLHGLAVLLMV